MAGHSKWANIKHRKAGQDAKRGKTFTKLIRELAVAAKLGGGEQASNPRLRTAIDKALSCNMTRDTVNRAIQRGIGGEEGANMESLLYEGYGPGGTALLVNCLTDNRNRTASEVRYAFSKCAGNLGCSGSVAYLFHKTAILTLELAAGMDQEALVLLVIEAGADDLQVNSESKLEILTSPDTISTVQQTLITAGYLVQHVEVTWRATDHVVLDQQSAPLLLRLCDLLEDLDDVQAVYHNGVSADVTTEALLA